jgi:hypothetical protein
VKSDSSTPQISVILPTDAFQTIRLALKALREERDSIELIIIGPFLSASVLHEEALAGFCAVHVIEWGETTDLSLMRAAGIRAATAPVVYLAETHSFPQPGWVQPIVAAHRGPWAVVMPGIANANPDTAVSWAQLVTDYGPWLQELPARVIDRFPTWPTSYKRDLLLAFGDRLAELLTQGDALVRALSEAGHRFYFEPAARVAHLNMSLHGPWMRERYYNGVSIASSRMGGWPWGKRLIYICGAPLIPAVLLFRARKGLQACLGSVRMLLWVIPAIAATSLLSAMGEAAGYAGFSAKAAHQAMTEYEIHREAY